MVVKHHQNRYKIHKRCTFLHSCHNWKYFCEPTFIFVHIGQDGIIVLNLYCLRSLSLFNDKSIRQDYCILILHNKASNTHSSDTFYQAPGITRQHI